MLSISLSLLLVTAAVTVAGQKSAEVCNQAFAALANDEDANHCIGIPQLSQIFSADPNVSVVGLFDNYLSSFCSIGYQSCPNVTLSWVKQETSGIDTEGCLFIPDGLDYLPKLRELLCFKDGKTFCTTQMLANIEKTTGPVTNTKIQDDLTLQIDKYDASVICTDCNKAVFNYLTRTNGQQSSGIIDKLTQLCGAAFVDGQYPPGITAV